MQKAEDSSQWSVVSNQSVIRGRKLGARRIMPIWIWSSGAVRVFFRA